MSEIRTIHDLPPPPVRALAPTMAGLRDQLAAILPLLGPRREVAYLDIPFHPNTGDRLIHAGTEAFCRQHSVRVVYRCTLDDYDPARLRSRLSPDTVIALHGGGNFGTLWPRHHAFRERVLRDWPDRSVVVLPQSIEFESAAARRDSAASFRAHKHLAICVRDRHSEAVAQDFADTVLCVPDMAHALWGTLAASGPPSGTEPLLLARTDKEATGRTLAETPITARVTDWTSELDARARLVRRGLRWLYGGSLRGAGLPLVPDPALAVRLDARYLIGRAVRLFSAHPLIVTDRLHGMLLACLLGRQVRYLDNSYGKLQRYVDCWLQDVAGMERLRRSSSALSLSPPVETFAETPPANLPGRALPAESATMGLAARR